MRVLNPQSPRRSAATFCTATVSAGRQLRRGAVVVRTQDSFRHLLNREHLAEQCPDQPERMALHLDWVRPGGRGAVAEEEHLHVAGMCFSRRGVAAHIGGDARDDDRLGVVGTENLIEVGTEECSEARLCQDDVARLDVVTTAPRGGDRALLSEPLTSVRAASEKATPGSTRRA